MKKIRGLFMFSWSVHDHDHWWSWWLTIIMIDDHDFFWIFSKCKKMFYLRTGEYLKNILRVRHHEWRRSLDCSCSVYPFMMIITIDDHDDWWSWFFSKYFRGMWKCFTLGRPSKYLKNILCVRLEWRRIMDYSCAVDSFMMIMKIDDHEDRWSSWLTIMIFFWIFSMCEKIFYLRTCEYLKKVWDIWIIHVQLIRSWWSNKSSTYMPRVHKTFSE